MESQFCFYVGIDWATQNHQVCLIDADGKTLKQKTIEHSGSGIAQLIDWLEHICGGDRKCVAVGIEIPHGAIVESLSEKEFAVFSINPKQLDRFRDRYSVSSAKDDSRDAFVLAASLRTDRSCFHRVCIDDPRIIRLRELSRFDDDLDREMTRLTNQLREQLIRYYPQILHLGSVVDDPWIWDLLELVPTPQQGHDLTAARAEAMLHAHRIRRINSADIMEALSVAQLRLAPGAMEAASEHMLFLLPQLRLIHQQRLEVARRIQKILNDLSIPSGENAGKGKSLDAHVLLSLPGVGIRVAATFLTEASQSLAERNYRALRCYGGTAPVTRQSGKTKTVLMRRGCNNRLRDALYHWARVSIQKDRHSREHYDALRQSGHGHTRALRGIADRWLAVLIAMLKTGTLYDPNRREQKLTHVPLRTEVTA